MFNVFHLVHNSVPDAAAFFTNGVLKCQKHRAACALLKTISPMHATSARLKRAALVCDPLSAVCVCITRMHCHRRHNGRVLRTSDASIRRAISRASSCLSHTNASVSRGLAGWHAPCVSLGSRTTLADVRKHTRCATTAERVTISALFLYTKFEVLELRVYVVASDPSSSTSGVLAGRCSN